MSDIFIHRASSLLQAFWWACVSWKCNLNSTRNSFQISSVFWAGVSWRSQARTPHVHSATSGPCIKVNVIATFFFGELNPATSSLRSRYSSTFDMKSSVSSLLPVKIGGFAPIVLTFAAAATGCSACCAAGGGPPPPPPLPPPPPPPPPPPLPPPPLPRTAMWSSMQSLAAERGCEVPEDVVAWVVVCVWVVVVVAIFGSWG